MSEFDGFFNQSISLQTIYTAAPIDVYGDASYNTATTVAANIQMRIKAVTTIQGDEAISNALITLPSSTSLDVYGRDKITLPASMGSRTPPILAIANAIDNDTGINDHWEVSV